MDHRAAVETSATERYLLGELDEQVRAAFEEHFFSCAQCADDVRASARFVANAKAVMRAEPVAMEEKRTRGAVLAWVGPRAWIPAALAASLFTAAVLPRLDRSVEPGLEVLPAAVQIPSAMRAGEGTNSSSRAIAVSAGDSVILLRLDVGDTIAAPVLKWTVRPAAGAGDSLVVTGPRQPEVLLRLPASRFPAGGRYEVVLSADTPGAPVLDRYPFTIQQQ